MTEKMKPSNAVGKRCLVNRYCSYSDDVTEATLLEISPSKKRLKWLWESGNSTWEDKDEYQIVEILPEIPSKQSDKSNE